MKKILIVTLLAAFLIPGIAGFSQDNIYGDYLMSTFDKRVSLDLEGAQMLDVLKMLSQQLGMNFVSTEAVRQRTLTLYLENVPLKEAMDIIFNANNLAYDYYPESNIFVVKEMGKPALELKTKIYYLKYARVKSSKLQEEIESLLAPEDEEEDDDETTGGSQGTDSLRGAVENVLSEVGKVSEDPLSNSLVVIDVPSQFPMIDEVISQLDIPPARIIVEVEMLDVSKTHVDKLGFDFTNGLTGQYTGGSRATSWPFPHRFRPLDYTKAISGDPSTFSLGALSFASFTSIMKFLQEDTSTKFIARPKILTVSSETAEVNLTANEVIGVTTTVSSDGTSTENIEREQTGTKLRVTPVVNPNLDEITLLVQIFNRESTDSGISVGSLSGNAKNVEERGTKNVVRLRNGETLFIGGLLRKEESETIRKIPILGDLPIIGRLFRYKESLAADNVDRELLVFLTPRILGETSHVDAQVRNVLREQYDVSKRYSVKVALDRLAR